MVHEIEMVDDHYTKNKENEKNWKKQQNCTHFSTVVFSHLVVFERTINVFMGLSEIILSCLTMFQQTENSLSREQWIYWYKLTLLTLLLFVYSWNIVKSYSKLRLYYCLQLLREQDIVWRYWEHTIWKV